MKHYFICLLIMAMNFQIYYHDAYFCLLKLNIKYYALLFRSTLDRKLNIEPVCLVQLGPQVNVLYGTVVFVQDLRQDSTTMS